MNAESTIVAAWGKADRAGIWLLLCGAIAIGLTSLVSATLGISSDLENGTRTLSLLTEQPLPATADEGSASIVSGTFDSAWLTVADLSDGAAALLTAGAVLTALTQLATASTFAYLAFRLLQRRPFLASLSFAFYLAGTVLAVGSVLANAFTGFGGWQVVIELSAATPSNADFWPLFMKLDPAPVAWGFALLAIGAAFQHATKLTRATDGLV
jgi:hypothetical protein